MAQRSAVFTKQRKRMLALLDIAYKLTQLGYNDEACPVFRLAAREGMAGLKHVVTRKVNLIDFDITASACLQAWRKAGPGAGEELREFETWLADHAPKANDI